MHRRTGLAALALCVVLAAGAGVVLRPFVGGEAFERDWCQHLWWTQRYADPDLFPGDRTAEFFSRPLFSPAGVRAWYRATVPLLGSEPSARVLSALLTLVSLGLAWRAGRSLSAGRPWLTGVLAACLLAVQPLGLGSALWGLPRSFSLPLQLLGIVALLEGRTVLLGATLVLCALLYPPAVLVVGGAAALAWVPRIVRERALPPRWPGLLALGLVAVGVLVATYRQGAASEEGFGPKVTREQARSMDEFGPHGRSRFFHDDPVRYWVRSNRSGLSMDLPEAVVTFAAVLAVALLRRPWWPAPLWGLLWASLLAFAAAHATLFALHLPNRYVSVSIPLFRALAGAALLDRALGLLLARRPRLAEARTAVRALVVAGLAAAALLVWRGVGELGRRSERDAPADFLAARAFLETLPKDALVAAHPADAETVPLRARRSVLASWETALPYWLGYYEGQRERIVASLDALYATRWEDVDALAARYGADVFLVNLRRLRPESEETAPPPFGEAARARREEGLRSGFVLGDPPADRILFARGSWAVVRVGTP